ncbi:MAG: hypothetical protein WCR15_00240 [Arcobacteraceae bacterium]
MVHVFDDRNVYFRSEAGLRYRAFSKPSMVEYCYRPASNYTL